MPIVKTDPIYIPADPGQPVKIVHNSGDTLYYDNASTVTSAGPGDGNLTTGTSATFTVGQYIVSAGTTNFDTVEQTKPLAGGISQVTAAHGFANWQPPTAISGTDTTPADGTQFVTSVFLPVNKTLTGISYLIGTVGGTDRVYAVLYDAAGNNLANSTLASNGTVCGTAASIQALAFTSTYVAKGPNLYYIGISAKGTTCRLRTVPAHCQAGLFGGSVSQTHATVAGITVPTTWTADKAPVSFLY